MADLKNRPVHDNPSSADGLSRRALRACCERAVQKAVGGRNCDVNAALAHGIAEALTLELVLAGLRVPASRGSSHYRSADEEGPVWYAESTSAPEIGGGP